MTTKPRADHAAQSTSDWRETYAYVMGMQAVIYGYPVVRNLSTRYFMVEQPVGQASMPVNAWYHARLPGTAADKLGSSIIDSLLYSAAWYDVSGEPLVITLPEAGERYYGMQLMEMYSDIFAYLGLRATGNRAGSWLLAGPHWKGSTPDGITRVIQAPTPTGMLLLRIAFDRRDDLGPTHGLQDATLLAPLSHWLAQKPFVASERRVLAPADRAGDPLWLFTTMNRGMTENPPPAKDRALLAGLASVGLGANQPDDLTRLDAATQAGLRRAMADGLALLAAVARTGGNAKIVNHWAYGQLNWGRTGDADDFLTRAATQSFSGMQEHHVEEVVKLRAHRDQRGDWLDGAQARYLLYFAPGQLPQADAFWSITLYDEHYDLVANEIDRYSRGSPDAELLYGADGSLDIRIQADPPAPGQLANWLPAPKAPFNLFLRAYLPGRELIDQSWIPPAVVRVD